MNKIIRSQILDTLSVIGRASRFFEKSLLKPRVHLLYFHELLSGDHSNFRHLIDWLSLSSEIVSYSEAIRQLNTNIIDRPYIAFSFDDGLKSCLQISKILDEYKIKACFFVNTEPLDAGSNWNSNLYCRERLRIEPRPFMNWLDLEDLLGRGHEIGGHTHGHHNLGNFEPGQFQEAIQTHRARLVQVLGTADHFSWPFGRFHHFSAQAHTAALEAGFRSIASAERGCHTGLGPVGPRHLVLLREHLMADWPLAHAEVFLATSARFRRNVQPSWLGEEGT